MDALWLEVLLVVALHLFLVSSRAYVWQLEWALWEQLNMPRIGDEFPEVRMEHDHWRLAGQGCLGKL